MNLRVTPRRPVASLILSAKNPMYFDQTATLKTNASRRERQDLVLLSREMEARHRELRKSMETSGEKLKRFLQPRAADQARTEGVGPA